MKQQIAPINPRCSYYTLCEHCASPSTDVPKCSNCGQIIPSIHYEKTFINFSIKDQLEIILNNNNIFDLVSPCTSNVITDITNGDVYKQLKTVCHEHFLTFTSNIDGVEVKKRSNKCI